MAGRGDEAERQRRHGLRVPLQDGRLDAGLLWEGHRGERQEQLRPHLRAS